MEKCTPHCPLATVKRLVQEGKVTATRSALDDAETLGFDLKGMAGVVSALTMNDFYKSMTTYADHRIWQDVYRPVTTAGGIYLKLTAGDGVLIVSFKEL